MADDLWPDDFGHDEQKPPVLILKEQAQLLSAKTRGLVLGWVESKPVPVSNDFWHNFYLQVPNLDDYLFNLFVVRHGVLGYPATVTIPTLKWHSNPESSDQLTDVLRRIFNDAEVKKIVRSLLTQAQASLATPSA